MVPPTNEPFSLILSFSGYPPYTQSNTERSHVHIAHHGPSTLKRPNPRLADHSHGLRHELCPVRVGMAIHQAWTLSLTECVFRGRKKITHDLRISRSRDEKVK